MRLDITSRVCCIASFFYEDFALATDENLVFVGFAIPLGGGGITLHSAEKRLP